VCFGPADVTGMLRKGPARVWRLLKNLVRFLSRRWERPVSVDSWVDALTAAGFEDVQACVLDHEGGIVSAFRPARTHATRVPYPPRRLTGSQDAELALAHAPVGR
jgi:hypothetical protein